MTDRDWLDRAIKLNEEVNSLYFKHKDEKSAEMLFKLFDEHLIDFLIKQAERVQELEERNEILDKVWYQPNAMERININKLLEQNKHYREALQEIKNKAKGDYFKTDIYILADEALEGEE